MFLLVDIMSMLSFYCYHKTTKLVRAKTDYEQTFCTNSKQSLMVEDKKNFLKLSSKW